MTQLKENDPWKFHAPSSDESGGEENVAPNGQFLFLSRPNTKGRDTDEESEYLNKCLVSFKSKPAFRRNLLEESLRKLLKLRNHIFIYTGKESTVLQHINIPDYKMRKTYP